MQIRLAAPRCTRSRSLRTALCAARAILRTVTAEAARNTIDYVALAAKIRAWGVELGFGDVGIAGVELAADEAHLVSWLDSGFHGEMVATTPSGWRRV